MKSWGGAGPDHQRGWGSTPSSTLARQGRAAHPISPPPIHALCRPRADVLEGRIRDEDFAADLSQVLKGTAPELYRNPALFFANRHPAGCLRDLFPAVVDRLTSAGSQLGGILRLDTGYGGGGKTHVPD